MKMLQRRYNREIIIHSSVKGRAGAIVNARREKFHEMVKTSEHDGYAMVKKVTAGEEIPSIHCFDVP